MNERTLVSIRTISALEPIEGADFIEKAFVDGPIDDGDVPSKSGRDSLLDSGYISKVVVKGEQGFNACTYKGSSAYKLIVAGA